MKRLFFIFVLFFLSAQLANAQEVKFPVLTGKKTEEAKKTTDAKKQPVADSAKTKKPKSLHNLPGGNWEMYQNYTGMLREGETLSKYVGIKRKIDSQSKINSWTTGWMNPGVPIVTNDRDETSDGFSKFSIFQCYNNSRIHEGSPIKKSELQKVVSYEELQQLKKGAGLYGIGKEDFLKLSELLERAFGDGGEIESMGDQLNSLNEKVDLLGKDVTSIRLSLGFNEGSNRNEKIESSSDWWKWALGATAVILGGVITYKLLQQSNNNNPTIIINPPAGSGGPVNPHN
ncbi:MAG: hypothetical protein M1320_01340 [Patescibacteria group bacterium]|nr:hypothetical protein [Patescibacteria group bacterium]